MSAKNLLEKYKAEINTHQFVNLIPLLSEDCSFWFSSGTYKGLKAAQDAFEKTWNLIQNEVYTITDVTWINEDTNTAACIYTFHWKGIVNGSEREGLGRGTSCFRIENGVWKIIHEHLSAFPQ